MSAILNQLWAWATDAPKPIPPLESNSPNGPTLTQAVRKAIGSPGDSNSKVENRIRRIESGTTVSHSRFANFPSDAERIAQWVKNGEL